jgi:hypothetical protein
LLPVFFTLNGQRKSPRRRARAISGGHKNCEPDGQRASRFLFWEQNYGQIKK